MRKVKDSDQYDEMKKKMEELNAIAQKIGAAMYQAAPGGVPGAEQANEQAEEEKKKEEGPSSAEATDDKPVEGEVVK